MVGGDHGDVHVGVVQGEWDDKFGQNVKSGVGGVADKCTNNSVC
jgi:hypothetical protein